MSAKGCVMWSKAQVTRRKLRERSDRAREFSYCLVPLALCLGVAVANAQDYPVRPVRFIVPFAPGGAADFTARGLAQKLTEGLGQQVVVDNRAGASGIIGVQLVAGSARDGYTLLLGSSSNLAALPSFPYDPIRDFAPISLAVLVPNILVAHPSVPAQSLKELIQLARAKPGQLSYASPGVGTNSLIAGELLNRAAGIRLMHVPYKGGGPALTDLLGGHVQLMFGGISTSLPMVRTGKLRALGVTSLKRVGAAPDIPTLSESGLQGYEIVQWFGVLAPVGTPRPIIGKLNGEIVKAIASPDLAERYSKQGLEPISNTPAEFAAHMKAELAKWSRLAREAGTQ